MVVLTILWNPWFSRYVWTMIQLLYYCVRLTLKAHIEKGCVPFDTTVKSEQWWFPLQASTSRELYYWFGVRRRRVREVVSFHASVQLLAVASSACTCTRLGRYVVWLTDILLALLSNVCVCIIKYIVLFVNINIKNIIVFIGYSWLTKVLLFIGWHFWGIGFPNIFYFKALLLYLLALI